MAMTAASMSSSCSASSSDLGSLPAAATLCYFPKICSALARICDQGLAPEVLGSVFSVFFGVFLQDREMDAPKNYDIQTFDEILRKA